MHMSDDKNPPKDLLKENANKIQEGSEDINTKPLNEEKIEESTKWRALTILRALKEKNDAEKNNGPAK